MNDDNSKNHMGVNHGKLNMGEESTINPVNDHRHPDEEEVSSSCENGVVNEIRIENHTQDNCFTTAEEENNSQSCQKFTLHDSFDWPALEEEVIDGCVRSLQDKQSISSEILNLFTDKMGQVKVHKVLAQLKHNGIRPFADFRLDRMIHRLSVDGLDINNELGVQKFVSVERFKDACEDCGAFLNKVLSSSAVIPEFSEFCDGVRDIFEELKSVNGGKRATYIPQLSRVNPNFWAVSICTIDGQRCSFGDTDIPFCIQSGSKPLNYAIAIKECGPSLVHEHIGKEPSGMGFNQIGLDKNGLPHNPMINAGAISCLSVMKRSLSLADRFDYVTGEYRKMAGNEFIGFSNATFLSEKSVADRNYAIGYYLKEHKVFPEDTDIHETLDLYFQLCSVEATADSSALISATLANGGVCPTTGEVCITPDAVRNTLSLMYSCGMSDYSGEWAFEVGLPAKSGVAGSVFIVIPGVMGICVWSPRLDELGNSYKGVLFAKKLVEKFAFHQFDTLHGEQAVKLEPTFTLRRDSREVRISNMLQAASNNDLVLLTRYLEIGVDFNMCDYDNRSALHLAVCNGHLNVVKFLITNTSANINALDRWQNTPLDDSIRYEFEDIQKFLKKKGGMSGQNHINCIAQHSN